MLGSDVTHVCTFFSSVLSHTNLCNRNQVASSKAPPKFSLFSCMCLKVGKNLGTRLETMYCIHIHISQTSLVSIMYTAYLKTFNLDLDKINGNSIFWHTGLRC